MAYVCQSEYVRSHPGPFLDQLTGARNLVKVDIFEMKKKTNPGKSCYGCALNLQQNTEFSRHEMFNQLL